MPPLDRRSLALPLLFLFAVVLAIGWFDYVTGPEIGMSLLYLLPVIVTGWRLGPLAGSTNASFAALNWFVADAVWYPVEHMPISAWNGFTRLVIFLSFALASHRLRFDREELMALNERLRAALEREQSLARTDALTGLANLLAFRERLNAELPRVTRKHAALCIAYLDLDNFKGVNDGFGHARGDELLRRVSGLIQQSVRAGDLPARLGGDEFAIALWDIEREAVEAVAARLVERVGSLAADYPGVDLGASMGIAFLEAVPASVDEALRAADAAMYAAKTAGKGRVVLHTSVPPPATPGRSANAADA